MHMTLAANTKRLNWISLWIGVTSCLGISIVANFQETNVRIVHLFGALLAFGLGTVYFCVQSVMTYYLHPYSGTMAVAHLRLVLSMVCVVFFMLVAIPGVISHILFEGNDPRHWYPSDGGWMYHVISSVSEWIVATAFCVYILSFTPEFRTIDFDHPQITMFDVMVEDRTPVVVLVDGDDNEAESSRGIA